MKKRIPFKKTAKGSDFDKAQIEQERGRTSAMHPPSHSGDNTGVWELLRSLLAKQKTHPRDKTQNEGLLSSYITENLPPHEDIVRRFTDQLRGEGMEVFKKEYPQVFRRLYRTASQKRVIPMKRTAGEVRFVKDNSNDASSWAWKQGPSERSMQPDYNYNPKRKKALAKVLRSTTASMGHAMSAYNSFTKIKSADVSPDGNLGGKGYIQKIMDMRKQYMNVVEALSALSDTIYDEINAPHWAAISRQETEEEKEEVAQIIQDAEEIKEDPEGWAEEQEEEMDEDHKPMARTASSKIPKKYLRGDK